MTFSAQTMNNETLVLMNFQIPSTFSLCIKLEAGRAPELKWMLLENHVSLLENKP